MAGHPGSTFGRPECRLVPVIHAYKSRERVCVGGRGCPRQARAWRL